MNDEIFYIAAVFLPDTGMVEMRSENKKDIKQFLDKYWNEAGEAKVFKSMTVNEFNEEFENES